MLELVFVIVVIGILAAVIIPRIERQPLREAAIQLVSDLRYTQHLAMVDDRYDITDANWSKTRWQLMFENTVQSNNQESYTIFSDWTGAHTGNADATEIAVNPSDTNKRLTGGTNGVVWNNAAATREMNFGMKYNITNVNFSNSCSLAGSRRIAFDHLGRPLMGNLAGYVSPYPNVNRIITADCNITLSNPEGDSVVVTISPETGYAYIRD